MPKDTKTLGNNKARACESLGFVHKKRLCQRFDTTSFVPGFCAKCQPVNLNLFSQILVLRQFFFSVFFFPLLNPHFFIVLLCLQ